MNYSFKNKNIVITGGTKGIGKALVFKFLKYGGKVITNSRDERVCKQFNKKRNIKCYNVNFLNKEQTNKFIGEIKNLSKIDVLINNAGINEINSIDKFNVNDWEELQKINLFTPFYLISKLTPLLKKSKRGKIVNISSIFGKISKEKRSVYSSTKSGLAGLNRGVALDLAKYNILSNCVSPGFVDTQLTRRILKKKNMKIIEKQIPLKRLASEEEIAELVIFLCSDKNTYITGQDLTIDGGFTIK